MTEDLVRLEDVVYRRGRKAIFTRLNLSVPAGSTVAVMGPSGTGKTTLLRLIGGQIQPDSGAVYIKGRNIADMSREELFAARRNMGMLFQSGALFSDLSVFKNVELPLTYQKDISREERKRREKGGGFPGVPYPLS